MPKKILSALLNALHSRFQQSRKSSNLTVIIPIHKLIHIKLKILRTNAVVGSV